MIRHISVWVCIPGGTQQLGPALLNGLHVLKEGSQRPHFSSCAGKSRAEVWQEHENL